jgi:bifunctional non-homologous end joining protein LigD
MATGSSTSGFIAPCIPTRAPKPPAGADWVHEIKHDGYRLQVRRVGDQVRLFTRRGYDWSGRYPAIAVTATLLRAKSFTLDGEAVVRSGWRGGVRRPAPPRHRQRGHALRLRPAGARRRRPSGPPAGRPQEAASEAAGRALAPHVLNTDEDGATIVRQACVMGLEGIVSKRLSAPYPSGPSRDWLKEPGQPRDDPRAES